MSTILAIETSTELASAALLRDGELVVHESAGVQTHSDAILPMIQRLLADAGIALRQCDAVAFGVGPGSFTGVRTACGVVQGLAFGADRPVLPVVTLEAMAQGCAQEFGIAADQDILTVLDARMGEVYWARYRAAADGGWCELQAPSLSAAALVNVAQSPVACGNGLAAYADVFTSDFIAQHFSAAHAQIMPHARHIAALGALDFARGKALPAQDAQPLYLRNKVALTTAEREAKAKEAGKGQA